MRKHGGTPSRRDKHVTLAACNGSSEGTQIIHECDQNFNDSQMYISAVNLPLVFMFSVRRQMSPVSARRVAFVFRHFPIGFIPIISNDFTLSHYVRWMHNEILCLLHFCRPGFLTIHIPPWSSMDLQVLRICRSQRLDMGLKRVSWVRRYQISDIRYRYDPWGIKATAFAITRKIRHYAAVTW